MLRTAFLLLLMTTLPIGMSPVAAGVSALDEGLRLYESGRYEQALPFLLRAVQAEPNNPRAWTWLGACYIRLNRFREAIEALQRAIRLDPRSVVGHFFLGIAYANAGQVGAARTAFQEVQRLDPKSAYARSAQAWLSVLAPSPAAASPSSAAPVLKDCPSARSVPPMRPPPVPKPLQSSLELSVFDVKVQREELLLTATVENLVERDFLDVRIQVTPYSLGGHPLTTTTTTVAELDSGDLQPFNLRLGTRPPIMWLRLQVVDFRGRQRDQALHSIHLAVDVNEYLELAKTRIALRAVVLQPEPAMRHIICLQVVDHGGFPLQTLRVRVTLVGIGRGQTLRQVKVVTVRADQGTRFEATWLAPVQVSATTQLEGIVFAPLPPLVIPTPRR